MNNPNYSLIHPDSYQDTIHALKVTEKNEIK